jgi:Rrf2 family protein
MLEIALHSDQGGVFQKDIAINQDISIKYLDYIIHALKAEGLITNAGGKKSGYVLARKPSEISMYDIHNAFEPGICIVDCLTGDFSCKRDNKCAVRKFWTGLNSLIIDYLKTNTLEDIVNQDFSNIKKNILMKKTILIVDDDKDLIRSIQVILESQDFAVISAHNKTEGLKKLKEEKPDLLVLDVMMDTNLEGYNMLHELKKEQEYKSLPVILLTGMLDELGVNLVAGVEDEELFPNVRFQDKPVDPLLLMEIIREMIQKKNI